MISADRRQAEVTIAHVLLALAKSLADRALRWTAVLMVFALTCYAVGRPDLWRFAAVAVFAALMAPLIWRRDHPKEDHP